MNLSLYISRHISSKDKENFSGPAVRIAIISISLGLAVMIISMAVLSGFQGHIRSKVTGFAADITIDNFDENSSYEKTPVSINQTFYPSIQNEDGIKHIQIFALKAGIIKTEDQIQGVVLKGIGPDYDWKFMQDNLVEGHTFHLSDSASSNEILISRYIANKLYLKTGDEVRMYFISGSESQPRGRKFRVSGIYETGLEDLDKVYVLGDIRHIQKLNNWSPDEVSGFEIYIDNFRKLNKMSDLVYSEIPYQLNTQTVVQAFPQIFDWLHLMDMNVVIILVLMVLVAGITMISTLLILILERTNMIGILKALGMTSSGIRRIFLYNSAYIVGRGLFWGNLAGITICLIQYNLKLFPLDQESYYMSYVPIDLQIMPLLLINLGTFLICLLMLILPSYIISRITPIKAIRFN